MNNKTVNKIMGILLLIFCIVGAIWGIARQNILKNANKIGAGKIIDFRSGGRGNAGGIWIDFALVVDGKHYKGSSRCQNYKVSDTDFRNYIVGRNFPVAYSPSNPSNSSILITPRDFSRFGYPFPDTLRWVLHYFKEE